MFSLPRETQPGPARDAFVQHPLQILFVTSEYLGHVCGTVPALMYSWTVASGLFYSQFSINHIFMRRIWLEIQREVANLALLEISKTTGSIWSSEGAN